MGCDAERLLQCVEARPPIYDFTLKEHANRTVVEKLWDEVAIEMKCSVAACKAKWTSLRNSYNRAVREGNAASITGGKRKKWYLMDAMAFLRDFVGVNRKSGGPTEDCTPDMEYTDSFIDNGEFEEEKCCRSRSPHDERVANAVLSSNQPDKISDEIVYFNPDNHNEEDPSLTFFRSLIPDVNKLSESRKRKFKLEVFSILDRELEEQEIEQSCK